MYRVWFWWGKSVFHIINLMVVVRIYIIMFKLIRNWIVSSLHLLISDVARIVNKSGIHSGTMILLNGVFPVWYTMRSPFKALLNETLGAELTSQWGQFGDPFWGQTDSDSVSVWPETGIGLLRPFVVDSFWSYPRFPMIGYLCIFGDTNQSASIMSMCQVCSYAPCGNEPTRVYKVLKRWICQILSGSFWNHENEIKMAIYEWE